MIEIICNGKEDESGKIKNTTEKQLPKNIKQVGDVGTGKRIYIEDYAFTYINSIVYQPGNAEVAGVLLGEVSNMEGHMCIFIKGVIKAKNSEDNGGEICFNETVWGQIYNEIEKYFPELSIVGWFAALPRITSEAIHRMKKIHIDNFAGKNKTMYLIDIDEKEENFYLYEGGDIKKQRGYVCFYERNYEMQEYMLDKNRHKSVEKPDTEKVVHSMRALMKEKEENRRQRKNSILSYSACIFMASVVTVTGINLVKSYEKMKRIDDSISSIVKEVSDMNTRETETVVQEDIVPVNVVYETKAVQNTPEPSENPTQTRQAEQTQPATSAIPTEASQQVSGEVKYKKYIVQQGDTILGIAKKNYGTTEKAAQIIDINNLEDANKLYVGQEIKLP